MFDFKVDNWIKSDSFPVTQSLHQSVLVHAVCLRNVVWSHKTVQMFRFELLATSEETQRLGGNFQLRNNSGCIKNRRWARKKLRNVSSKRGHVRLLHITTGAINNQRSSRNVQVSNPVSWVDPPRLWVGSLRSKNSRRSGDASADSLMRGFLNWNPEVFLKGSLSSDRSDLRRSWCGSS